MELKKLNLKIKKDWFDMILKGEKKEEYRRLGDYWTNRIVPWIQTDLLNQDEILCLDLQNGYSPESRRMIVEVLKVSVDFGLE